MSVSEDREQVVRETERRSGLSQALHDATHGFITGVQSLIRHSGRALLVLLVLGAVSACFAPAGGWRGAGSCGAAH